MCRGLLAFMRGPMQRPPAPLMISLTLPLRRLGGGDAELKRDLIILMHWGCTLHISPSSSVPSPQPRDKIYLVLLGTFEIF